MPPQDVLSLAAVCVASILRICAPETPYSDKELGQVREGRDSSCPRFPTSGSQTLQPSAMAAQVFSLMIGSLARLDAPVASADFKQSQSVLHLMQVVHFIRK